MCSSGHTCSIYYTCTCLCKLSPFYLYQFSVWFWYLYLLLEWRFFPLKLLEDRPLSRVQIIRIHFVYCWPQGIHSSMPSRSIFLSLSGGPASLHVRLLLPVVTLGAWMSPCQWLQLLWSYTDNIYYWFTLRLACLLEYLATLFQLQAYVWIKVNEWGLSHRESNTRGLRLLRMITRIPEDWNVDRTAVLTFWCSSLQTCHLV